MADRLLGSGREGAPDSWEACSQGRISGGYMWAAFAGWDLAGTVNYCLASSAGWGCSTSKGWDWFASADWNLGACAGRSQVASAALGHTACACWDLAPLCYDHDASA